MRPSARSMPTAPSTSSRRSGLAEQTLRPISSGRKQQTSAPQEMDWSLFLPGPQGWGDELLAGLWLTIRLGLTAVLLGTALGLGSALAELSRFTPIARVVAAYDLVMRSVPELLVI